MAPPLIAPQRAGCPSPLPVCRAVAVEPSPCPSAECATAEKNVAVLAQRYMDAHYDQPFTLDDLAGRFYVSKYHLSHAFSRYAGQSVYQYLLQRRLAAARKALEQNAAPSEAFSCCGFADYANFYRAFKAAYGCGPRAYAAQYGTQKK